MIPIVVISGPTAVGKTEFVLWLSQQLPVEIISADSVQIYQKMDIGTAKPDPQQLALVPHHLINLVPPDEDFSVADYQAEFRKVITGIRLAGKIPVLTGGTGLYIRSVLQQYNFHTPGSNPEIRQSLAELAEKYGNIYLHERLQKIDGVAAAKISSNDLRRMIRALEVYEITGIPFSQQSPKEVWQEFWPIYLFLNRRREELYLRAEARVDEMIQRGLVQEVETLLNKGYSSSLKSLQSLGYKQICNYLEGKSRLEEAIAVIKKETKKYAKRQLTWFRREPIDFWVNISQGKQEFYLEMLNYIEGRIEKLSNRRRIN